MNKNKTTTKNYNRRAKTSLLDPRTPADATKRVGWYAEGIKHQKMVFNEIFRISNLMYIGYYNTVLSIWVNDK